MKKVLILCTGNSCRSQIAEGYLNHFGGSNFEVHSAGSKPAPEVHPLAIKVMHDDNIDITSNQPKNLTQFLEVEFDYLITVCDNAKEACPIFPGNVTHIHCSFEDPAHAEGTEEEQTAFFKKVRDQIKEKMEEFVSQKLV